MKPDTWYKQPWESRICEIECSDAIPTGAEISAAAVKIYDGTGEDKSSEMIEGTPSFSGTKVYAQIKGGTNGEKYNCQVRLTLDPIEYAEDDIKVIVREKK